jgi:hypothetical protein
MKSSIHALIHACTLFTGISAMGDTIAYWRFEGDGVTVPTAGNQIEDSNGRTATNTGVGIRAVDSSGNGNTIWAWEHAWAGHTYESGTPWPIVPQSGAPNGFFAKNSGDYPALFTWSTQSVPSGVNLDTWTSLTWTIEASCYTSDLGDYRTVVGREGNGVETANANAAPVYFQKQNNDRFRIAYIDASGVARAVEDPNPMVLNQWYHYAATCDGLTLKLFRKTTGDASYTMAGSLDVSTSTNAALIDPGNDINGQPWGWTVGRGRYGVDDNPSQNHGDRWFGGIDEVRISDVALEPGLFLASANANDSDNDGLPSVWESAYGLDPNSNAGVNGATGDLDNDGFTNLQEYEGGSLPNSNTSVPGDIDGDGLADAWETTHFAGLQQTGSADPDGDLASNEQEETAGTSPVDPTLWPDNDTDLMNDAWETVFFGNLSKDGTIDSDGDSYTDLEEHDAHTNPTAVVGKYVSPIWSTLKHRWSFNNSLDDSVGGSTAQIIDIGANEVTWNSITTPTGITLSGGAKAASDYVKLGSNLLPDSTTPVTIELWARQNTIRNWSRIIDFHTDTNEELFMSWSTGTNDASERVEWRDNGVVSGVSDSNQPYGTTNEHHIVMTIQPLAGAGGTTRVTWYSAPAGQADLGPAQGTFDTTISLVNFNDTLNALGFSPWPDDTASATYNEVRIWNGALFGWMREKLHDQGPDNAAIADTDGDSLPDAWEETYFPGNLAALGTMGDFDGDGAANRDEYIAGSAPNNILSTPDDIDGDGLADWWETGFFTNITAQDGSGDPDNDGFTNEQEETNGTDPTSDDNDYDNLSDNWEKTYFTNWPTPGQTDPRRFTGIDDPDGDTFDNEAEEIAGSNPTVAASVPGDVDGDGLLDSWETTYFGNTTAQIGTGDPDNDTFTNEQEETAKSDPTLASSVPGDINADGIPDGHLLVIQDPLGTASFNSGTGWDDTMAPITGSNYLVTIPNLRTPEDANPYTFAGDKLVITTGGSLVVKGTGLVTIPYLGLDGALINNASSTAITLAGAFHVTRASEIWANNFSIVVDATIAGTRDLNITRSGTTNTVTLNAANTLTGNLNVTGGLILSHTGSLRFAPAANTITNSIGGTGSAVFNGTFNIDLGSASTAVGDSWTLVNAATLAETYDNAFTITGFTADGAPAGARKWTSAAGTYQFDESTGVLTRIDSAANDSDTDGMDDTWENTYFSGLGQNAEGDYDADGTDNLTEYRLGLTPNSGTSRFAVTRSASGLLSWPSATGLTFTVQRSTTLGVWANIATIPGTAGTASFTDPSAPQGSAFYRILLNP